MSQRKTALSPLEKARKRLTNFVQLLWACRGMIVFGFLTSAAGNVLHAEKTAIPVGISLLAPALLLFAFEMLSRIPLPPEGLKWYSLRRCGTYLRILAMGAIAAVTIVISYRHQSSAFMKYGGDPLQAMLLPGAIDAFMLVGSLSVLEIMIFIRALEDKIAAMELSSTPKEDVTLAPEKPLTGKERIAMAYMDMPWAGAKEIAAKAGTTEGYTATVLSDLRKARRTSNGASAVTVAN